MKKQYAFGEVKAVKEAANPNGEFEVILSMPTLDRDGEIIDAKAFEPLPASVPFHAFHDFSDPIGRAAPYYDGDVLKAKGFFASTPRAQEIRTLVADGIIGHTSVGFMPPVRDVKEDGVVHILKGELLEGSFVSVPSNRDAAVLLAKSFAEGLLTPDEIREKEAVPAATDPEQAAAPAAASPADVPVGMARLAAWRAVADSLLID